MGLVGSGWCVPAKPCDSCKSGSATLYCRPDAAFLCLGCDARIHSTNKVATRHERVWLCDVCEQAPAAVTCKADAAALCVTCDADIHSANPLSQRHERVPVEPFFDSADSLVKASALNLFVVPTDTFSHHCSDDGSDTTSLLIPADQNVNSGAPVFFPEMDQPFLDFADSVVPVQTKPVLAPVINIDFCRSKISPFTHQTISCSSLDVGVVPDAISDMSAAQLCGDGNNYNSISDMSYSLGRVEPTTMTAAQPAQLCGVDREARVLRYREKRKNRKFEKTIRYASRKAYAETRPRIKGRFAKRIETGAESEGLYGNGPYLGLGDCQYGVVPSF